MTGFEEIYPVSNLTPHNQFNLDDIPIFESSDKNEIPYKLFVGSNISPELKKSWLFAIGK